MGPYGGEVTTIVALRLDGESQERFEALRRAYFPPERNLIGAHVTLFHTLPDSEDVAMGLAAVAGRRGPFGVEVSGVRSLGRGVAFTLESAELLRVHGELAEKFGEYLTAQDRQRFMPHVVVQNKVTSGAAAALLTTLRATFEPATVEARGLQWWEYLGGPWRLKRSFDFVAG